MSIANRVGALVVAALLALLAVDAYVLQSVVLPSYAGMDEARTREEIKRVRAELDNELGQLERLATDWAAWDDAYRFVKDRNQEFLKSNLETSAMIDQRLALMWYVDADGKTVWGRALNPDQPAARPHPSFPGQGLPANDPLIRVKEPDIGVSGVMETPLGPMAVASRPVVTSHFQGPVRGFVIFGRLLDQKYWKTMSERLGVDVTGHAGAYMASESPEKQALSSVKPSEVRLLVSPGGRNQTAFAVIFDLEGRPVILLKTETERRNLALGQETLRVALAALAISGVLMMGLIYLLLSVYVTRPLQQLAQDIKSLEGGASSKTAEILPAAKGEVARVSKEVKGMLDRIAYLSHIDGLTGLPNRSYFTERATHALALSRRHEMKSAVLLLDLDGFKEVNETLGHEAGDRLLAAVAGRLRSILRDCDTLARFGGDEFLILAENLPAITGAADLAVRILNLFKEPLTPEDIRHGRTCSIGIAIFPDDAQTVEDLLRKADIAMYRAKSSGGNTWRCHADSVECRHEKGPEKSPAPSQADS